MAFCCAGEVADGLTRAHRRWEPVPALHQAPKGEAEHRTYLGMLFTPHAIGEGADGLGAVCGYPCFPKQFGSFERPPFAHGHADRSSHSPSGKGLGADSRCTRYGVVSRTPL